MWGNVTSKKRSNEFDGQLLTTQWWHICLSSFFNPLLAQRLLGLLTVLFHTIVLGWFMKISFGNSSIEDIWVYAFLGWQYMSKVQLSCFQQWFYYRWRWHTVLSMIVFISINRAHTRLLSYCKSKWHIMSQVKATCNHLRWLQVVAYHFTQCIWPAYLSWIPSLPSFIMSSWFNGHDDSNKSHSNRQIWVSNMYTLQNEAEFSFTIPQEKFKQSCNGHCPMKKVHSTAVVMGRIKAYQTNYFHCRS